MSKLHIGYLNVGGLRADLLNCVPTFLNSSYAHGFPPFDILFIAETWFTPPHHSATTHPLFIGTSSRPPPTNNRARDGGGVLCFGSPLVKNLLTSVSGSIDRIDLRFPSFSVTGVYAAPSLDNSTPFREKVAP